MKSLPQHSTAHGSNQDYTSFAKLDAGVNMRRAGAGARRGLPERRVLQSVADAMADPDSDEDLFELAQDAVARGPARGRRPRHHGSRRREAARAAVDGRDADAGRSAADCLYSRLDAGTDYVVGEPRVVLGR